MKELELKLTNVYQNLVTKAESFSVTLNHRVYKCELDLSMSSLMHYIDEEAIDIFYPIVLVRIIGLCHFEFWLDKIIVTARTNINNLLNFDISKLNIFNYDLYGCKEYPYMFYNKNISINLKEKLEELKKLEEKEIGIQIYLPIESNNDDLGNVLNFIRKQEIFYYNK